jgi:hypothetical protein
VLSLVCNQGEGDKVPIGIGVRDWHFEPKKKNEPFIQVKEPLLCVSAPVSLQQCEEDPIALLLQSAKRPALASRRIRNGDKKWEKKKNLIRNLCQGNFNDTICCSHLPSQ